MSHREDQHRELFAGNPQRRETREKAADAEQELDPEQAEEQARDGDGDHIARSPQPRGDDRQDDEHRDGAGQVQVDAPSVSEQRAEHDLRVHEPGRQQREPLDLARDRRPGHRSARSRQQRDRRQQREERLRQAAVENRERVVQEHHPEPAQQPLGEHDDHGQEAEAAEPTAQRPERRRQAERQHPDEGTDQAVAVLVEDPAHHPRPGEQEHVVAERARPVRHRERGAGVRDQPPEQDEHARRGQRREGEAMRHRALHPDQCRRAPAAPTGGTFCGRKSSLDSGELYS